MAKNNTHLSFYSFCVQESAQYSQVLCIKVSYGLPSGIGEGWVSSEGLHGCWQNPVSGGLLEQGSQFLAYCWLKATIISSLQCGPPPNGYLLHQIQEGKRELASNIEVTILCNIIVEVTPHPCAIISQLKRSHKSPLHSREGDSIRA